VAEDSTQTQQTPAIPDSGAPVLPLRDVVVYPHMVIPLFVGRDRSVQALNHAMQGGKQIVLVAQKQADVDEPGPADMYDVGTLATILQLLKLPDGTVKVLVEGGQRVALKNVREGEYFNADIEVLEDEGGRDEREVEVLTRSIVTQFENYVKLSKKVPPEILTSLAGIDHPGRLADTVAAHMSLRLSDKQRVLEAASLRERLELVMALVEGEIDVLQIEKRVRGRVKQQMEKSQREYYLNEQMKAIQKELGDMNDEANEVVELEKKIEAAGMPAEAKEKAVSELEQAEDDVADVRRGDRGAQLHRLAAEGAVEEAHAHPQGPRTRRGGAGTRTTTGSRRSRSASSSTWRCSSGSRSRKARSCAWWGRRASARPRWARASRAPPTASSCA
jgi:ATP-dependent Lon protease